MSEKYLILISFPIMILFDFIIFKKYKKAKQDYKDYLNGTYFRDQEYNKKISIFFYKSRFIISIIGTIIFFFLFIREINSLID